MTDHSASSRRPAETTTTHLVVFVHGWKGNTKELRYLRRAMERQAANGDNNVICYSATCNVRKTNDGVENGGRRLAREVEEQLTTIDGPVSLSLIGYSLGGLYSRYAIAHLQKSERVTPCILCTIATPHLGVHRQTWHWLERVFGFLFGATMRDLLIQTSTLMEMGTNPKYLDALRAFQKRIAVANAYKTDCLVSTSSAAFLSTSSRTLHQSSFDAADDEKKHDSYALTIETKPSSSEFDTTTDDMSQNLDALGWTKVMLDVRDAIPFPSIRNPFSSSLDNDIAEEHKELWTSQELMNSFDRVGPHWKPPFGHPVSCASYKNPLLQWFTVRGTPIMDQLAQDLLANMAVASSSSSSV